MGKNIRFSVEEDTEDLKLLVHAFPERATRMLAIIGVVGAKVLYKQFLSGQELTYKGRGGKSEGWKATGDVIGGGRRKLQGVKFRSYPLNLFEFGRELRSGRRQKPMRILTGKFASVAQAQLQRWAARAKRDAFPEL